jgi:hypothetical protein
MWFKAKTSDKTKRRFPMRSKKTLTAVLSTAILLGMLGTSSVALASERDDGGGYKVGPLGQVLGDWNGNEGRNAYGFAPSHQRKPAHKHTNPANAQ